MRQIILTFFIYTFFWGNISAQEDSVSLQKFVRVYLSLQSQPDQESISYDSILTIHLGGPLTDKYKNYLSGKAGKDLSYFSDDELMKIHQMLGELEAEEIRYKKRLLRLALIREKLDVDIYQKIYSRYKNDIKFADSLKAYFKAYIKEFKADE
jgi:hypothetical protein